MVNPEKYTQKSVEALREAQNLTLQNGNQQMEQIHLLRALHDYETCDLMINGAVPEWQNKGVSAVYYKDMSVKAKKIGNIHAITNPQIETNSAVNIWSSYDSEPFMRRRCYLKTID